MALIQTTYGRIPRFLQMVQPYLRAAGASYYHYLHISQRAQQSLFHKLAERRKKMDGTEKTKLM